MDNIGVSQKIENEQERQRLRDAVASVADGGGYILRTAAEGAGEEDLSDDVAFLHKLWEQIEARISSTAPGQPVYDAMSLDLRILRDLPLASIDRVRVDSRETYLRAVDFAGKFIPGLVERIEHYPGERPIFDLYSIDDEIQKALDSKVQLKSGGYLNIDQTESMTTIDVNTGAFVGHRNMEETIFKTNLEASQAIARQLRLRNLGGIIIIDFIDMLEDEHKRQVLRALEKGMVLDRARHHICEVSPLGLVEMTRERSRESLEHILCETCPTCAGRGSIRTRQTTCYEIFREIIRESRQFEAEQFLVMAAQDVVAALLDEESDSLAELELFIGKSITLQVETAYSQEQYDVVML
jgi:ribonuclease G